MFLLACATPKANRAVCFVIMKKSYPPTAGDNVMAETNCFCEPGKLGNVFGTHAGTLKSWVTAITDEWPKLHANFVIWGRNRDTPTSDNSTFGFLRPRP